MGDPVRKQPPNLHIFQLTFLFFGCGLVLFLITMGAGVRLLPELAAEQSARGPAGWFLTHAFLLGFATMIAMGASYQLTQVMMRTSLFSRPLGYAHLALYVPGVAGLLAGFASDAEWIALGGWGVALGACLYAINVAVTFVRKREWNLFVLGVSLSLLAFLVMIAMGIVMGIGMANGWGAGRYDAIFGTHLWLGVGGWLSGLILVYSFKLLPMFYVSRKKPTVANYWMVGGFHLGVWLHVLALWLDAGAAASWAAITGDACVLAAVVWSFLFFREVREMSSGKQPIGVVRMAYHLLPVVILAYAAWCVARWYGAGFAMMNETLVLVLVLGWFAPTIFAYLSKIFPFLWWARRFRTKEEKKTAPLLSEMIAEKRMVWELGGYLAGVAAVACGFGFGWGEMVLIGQAAALACILMYLAELVRVFRH